MWFMFKMNVTTQEIIFHQEWRKCYIQQGGECLLSNGWNNITTLEETKQFRWRENLQKQTFKWRNPANRGEWLLTEALLFQTMPRQLMRLHSPFNICVANVCQNICIYRIGNTCTLLEIHVPHWKYMYPIGNICTILEIYVPFGKFRLLEPCP